MDETYPIFQSWCLQEQTCSKLIEQGIRSILLLKKMEIQDVEPLFNAFDNKNHGERILFKAGLRQWRQNMNIPFSSDVESQSNKILQSLEKIADSIMNLQESRPTTPDKNFEGQNLSPQKQVLEDYLKSTVKGQQILNFHEKYGYLNDKSQKCLTQCIVEKYVSQGIRLTYTDMQKWATTISELFPKEKSETYYLPRKNGEKNPTGKLYSRWSNSEKTIFNFAAVGENKTFAVELPNDEFCEKKCWLQHNCTPWTTVLTYWRETFVQRTAEEHNTLTDFLKEWPRYNDFNGHELIENLLIFIIYYLLFY